MAGALALREAARRVPGLRAGVRRIRRAVFTRDLRRLHDVLAPSALGGRYAVCGGLLLGWARDGRLLADDLHDADFVFDVADTAAFAAAVPRLARAGFVPSTCLRNNDGDAVEYRFVRHGAQFEFFVVSQLGERTRYFMFDVDDELVCERLRQPNAPFDFLGRRWLKPADHDRALTDNYGDWRQPTPGWGFANAGTVIARHPARYGAEEWNGTVPDVRVPERGTIGPRSSTKAV